MKKHNTPFQIWLQRIYMDHKDELASYGQSLPYSAQEYFGRYKFWLKREYRHQRGKEDGNIF